VARNEHLPIYKAGFDLCLYFEQMVRGLSAIASMASVLSCATVRAACCA